MSKRLCPAHPILPTGLYETIGFSYGQSETRAAENWIDITLRNKRTGELRRLRFIRPRDIRISGAFSSNGPAIFVDDIRSRQLEDLRVEFGNYENSEGGLQFLAADVMALDKQEEPK